MCPTTVKLFLISCGDPKDHSKWKMWLMMVFKKFFKAFKYPWSILQKLFFYSYLVSKLEFSEKNAENREFFLSPPLKKNCDVMGYHKAIFWKACILSFTFNTHHIAGRRSRRKLRPHFHRKFFKKSSNSYHFTPITSNLAVWVIAKSQNEKFGMFS